MIGNRFRQAILVLGDMALLYLSLFTALALRYGGLPSREAWKTHAIPFFFIYVLWMLIFYIAGLYEIEKFFSASEMRNKVFKTMVAAGAITVLFFYLAPINIAPKTNLLLNLLVASVLVWGWRKLFFNAALRGPKIKVFFFGKEGMKEILDFADFLYLRPQLGYEPVNYVKFADIIVVPEEMKGDKKAARELYEMALAGKTIMSFDRFYESITGKIPVSLISERWFLGNFAEINKQNFEKIKRAADVALALAFAPAAIAVLPFAAAAIKLNGKGPVFYRQKRAGKNGKVFEIIKFRSMVADAEKEGARWAEEGDRRITFVGNILRKTRIDELPQILNVLRGELSFVGPRPERPEFVKELEEKIPHYSMRHLVKPGLTGWAQINFPYGASVKDAMEKLQYDLYYIKNRSIPLEIVILLKTILVVLSRKGR